ncbi:MAG: 2-oxoacid:acceptor oxidoreductase family protein [Planctomycetota bacterium]|jgi:indolepyruvate ferredoxin oxidoreductase beta subunit
MMNRKSYDMVLVGVGGQGLMLLSNVIGGAAAAGGMKVITAENHGLAQRGGSTGVHLRVGEEVHSPLIPLGCADLLLSMELTEALRYIEFLRERRVPFRASRSRSTTSSRRPGRSYRPRSSMRTSKLSGWGATTPWIRRALPRQWGGVVAKWRQDPGT